MSGSRVLRIVGAFGLVVFGAVFAGSSLGACNAVLGIEKASLVSDPLSCDNYCNVMAQNCQGTNAEYLPAGDGGFDTSLCMQMCGMLTPGTHYDYPGDAGIASGENTLGCRLWHAHAAGDLASEGPMAPEVHCPHAGPLGFTVCVDPGKDENDNFCALDVPYCYGYPDPPITVYDGGATEGLETEIETADESTCGAALRQEDSLADGGFYLYSGTIQGAGDIVYAGGNTLNCRLWHLEFAIQTETDPSNGPKAHCPHTGDPSVNADGTQGPCTWPDGGPGVALRRTLLQGRGGLCASRVAASPAP